MALAFDALKLYLDQKFLPPVDAAELPVLLGFSKRAVS